MRIAILLCILALSAYGCTITIKPIPQKKTVVYRTRYHNRTIFRETEIAAQPQPQALGDPLRNLKAPKGYKLITPTPNPEYNP